MSAPLPTSRSLRTRLADSIILALTWRYAAHSLMLGLTLLNETTAAPRLPDLLLDHLVPFVPAIWKWNYHIWVVANIPVAIWLWSTNRRLFLRYLWIGGILSILRGLMVPLTTFGPPHGADVNAGLSTQQLFTAWLDLVNPLRTLAGNAAHIHLTKDMFFSGHIATTFLLFLYAQRTGSRPLTIAAMAGHLLVVIATLVSHLHYTVDFIGAYAVTYCVYRLCERRAERKPTDVAET